MYNFRKEIKKLSLPKPAVIALSALITAALWIGLWALAAYRVGYDFLLPSPLSVIKSFFKIVTESGFWVTVLFSVLRVLGGFTLGAVLGLFGAFLSCFFIPLKVFFSPMIKIVRATPVASFILIAVLWMPSGTVPIFISFLMVFPIVYSNVLTGLENADNGLIECAKMYRLSAGKRVILLYLPTALPYFASAALTSLGLAWKSSVAAEVLSVTKKSIGEKLYLTNLYFESAELFAWTVVVILLSVGMEALIKLLAAKIKKKTRRRYERSTD